MLLRLLLIALAVAAVLWLVRTKRSDKVPPPRARDSVGPPGRMVRCAVCALHLPAADAVADGDTYYCGEAHRAAARSRRG
jgi:uncharacterized protein